ncbi:MAG: hypothetical protein LBO20_10125 [Bifidobacteriaceae bacterium]|nr:hypothetical protein [Bifidobacteriaceae bacterium]
MVAGIVQPLCAVEAAFLMTIQLVVGLWLAAQPRRAVMGESVIGHNVWRNALTCMDGSFSRFGAQDAALFPYPRRRSYVRLT